MATKDSSNLADVLFPSLEEQDLADSVLNIPPEQRRLHTETYDFNVVTLVQMLKSKHIFVPEFQRRYVWSDAQASRLIESLIIQCPIPVLYLNQERDERLSVIDGNQRLISISRYLNNEFPLKGLTAYPELRGLRFSQLDKRFQRHIENRTLRCIAIMKDTHPQVKFDVFERINSGSVRLTSQEIRHGLNYGEFMQLVEKLAKNKDLAHMLEIRNDKRMKTEELIIRFFALHFGLSEYKKPLSGFLNSFAESRRDITKETAKDLETLFVGTVSAVRKIFGNYAFKIFDKKLTIVSQFNAAIFDAEMVGLSLTNVDPDAFTKKRRDQLIQKLADDLESDGEFFKAITQATSDELNVKRRINHLKKLIAAA